jgi:hypothetical protein
VSRFTGQPFSPVITTVCWCLVIVCSAATSLAQETDERPPTSLEQTLADHVCSAIKSSEPHGDEHEQCVDLQFRALRAEFGYDLSQLTTAERGHVDATCSRLRRPENVEPYLNCVTSFLVAAREQRRGADGMAPAAIGVVTFGIPSIPVRSSTPPPSHGRFGVVLLLLLAGGAVAGGAGFALRLKKRPQTRRVCQKCGEPLNAAGDLCATCRHDAGIAAKQAIAERAAEERAEQERKKTEREQEHQRQLQQEQRAAETQRLEEERRKEDARRQADIERHQAEMARMPVPVPVVAAIGADVDDDESAELDPYKLLGVARGATRQDIDRAYCLAASKYDETQVAHLGDAVQQHYRAKAEAIERAYRSLIGTAA